MTRRALALLTAAALTLSAVGAVAVSAGALGGATASAAVSRATLTVHNTKYGKAIFDGRGRVLYLFGRDRGKKSTCYGSCAKAWPPFLTKGTPKAGTGARKGLIGTTKRKDGRLQVTYGGHPLYYYEGDGKGQVKCQGVNNSGGIWLVVSPAGKAIR
jgi:predicted lipoprotein with Yx(FWY)xxD motif